MTGHVFRADDGRLFMVRCPRCGKENYAMAVSSGSCCWCGEVAQPHHLADATTNNADWPPREHIPVDRHETDKPAGEISLPNWRE